AAVHIHIEGEVVGRSRGAAHALVLGVIVVPILQSGLAVPLDTGTGQRELVVCGHNASVLDNATAVGQHGALRIGLEEAGVVAKQVVVGDLLGLDGVVAHLGSVVAAQTLGGVDAGQAVVQAGLLVGQDVGVDLPLSTGQTLQVSPVAKGAQ